MKGGNLATQRSVETEVVMNLSSVMPFEGTSNVLASLPTVSPAIPEKLPRRRTAKTHMQDEEVAADIVRSLRETQRETGYSLADDVLEASFPRDADPSLLRAVLQNCQALGVQTIAYGSTELTEKSLKPYGTTLEPQMDLAEDEDETYCHLKQCPSTTDVELRKVHKTCDVVVAHSSAAGIREEMENLVELIGEALEENDSEENRVHGSCTKSKMQSATMASLLFKVRAYRDGNRNMITSLPLERSKTYVRKLRPYVEDLLAVQSMPAASREKSGNTVFLGIQAFLVMLEIVALDVQHSQELLTEEVILLVRSFLTFSANCALASSGYSGSELEVSRSGAVLKLDDPSSLDDADGHPGFADEESWEQRRPAKGLPSARDHSKICSKAFECLEVILVGGYRCSDSALAHFSQTAMLCLKKANAVSLQVSAMGLIRTVFRCRTQLRDQLLFEVRQTMERFVSLRENPRELRLRDDGSGIRVTSALVVQMIQSACSFESLLEATPHMDLEELCKESFAARASSVRSSDFFARGFVQRFLVEKDNELRSVFQVFVDDVMVLYGKPEWPGAETLLESLCSTMIGLLRPPANERRAPGDIHVRVACIDVLVALATRIRRLQLAKPSSSIPRVEEGRRSTLLTDLFHRSKADPAAADAFCAWACRFAAAGKLSQASFEARSSSVVTWTRQDVVDDALGEVRFGFLPQTGLASVLDVVASSLRDPSARMRAKGLMAMSEIGRVDPRQFRQGSTFRSAVEEKCLDVSASVRESALDLLCRVSIALMELDDEDENFEDQVYNMVSSRLADTSTTVRKRAVINLRDYVLKIIARSEAMRSDVIYQTNRKGLAKDESFIAEACSKLVLRLDDQEVTVGEIACKALSVALFRGNQPGLVNMPMATIVARRLVETTMHIAKSTQPRFLNRLLREYESLSDSSTVFLEKVVFCVLREMLDAESMYADVDNSKEQLKDPVLYILACSALLASFAQVNPVLLKSHCRVLLPALKEVPWKGLEAANARNILSIFEACIPSMENQALDVWAELEEDLTCIVKTTKNDLLAAAAIKCHCTLSRSIPARDSFAPEVAETFGRFIDMARENPVNMWQSCLHSLAPAIHRLGLYSRYLDLSPVVAETHFLRLDYWSSNVEFEARGGEFGSAFARIRESALQSLASFAMGNRRFLPRIVGTWRRALQMRMDVRTQTNFQYRVLSDLQEMLTLEEREASRQRNEQSTSDNGAIGAEEDAEAGYLVSCVQELYRDIQKTVFCIDRRVRLKAVMVFGLSIREGLILPVVAVPSLIALYADREERSCRDHAHRILQSIAERHPLMLYSQVLSGILESFQVAYLTSGHITSPSDLAIDQRSGYALVSPVVDMLPPKRRRELVVGILGQLVSNKGESTTEFQLPCNRANEGHESKLAYLAAILASLDYGGLSAGYRGTADARTKHFRNEVSTILASIAKQIANKGNSMLQMLESNLTDEEKDKLAHESFGICLLVLLKQALKTRVQREADVLKDTGPDQEARGGPEKFVPSLPLLLARAEPGSEEWRQVVDSQIECFQSLMSDVSFDESEIGFEQASKRRRREDAARSPSKRAFDRAVSVP
ncbi:hypothetical protein NDN08_000298 [Rhodosorus marinus]|uniref:Sister chromatid cohesion protein n=1 Tax=Rhodosorus marinus TaxID=101924 RepID=A0AAV8UMU2_9RHOD|nr:hypothetical protein NDN08_000298 [Rhodosorus marinus]